MISLLFRRIFAISLLILLADANSYAQWKNIAPGLLPHYYKAWEGSIAYSEGRIIAGLDGSIGISSDDGATWQLMPLPSTNTDGVIDLDIYKGKYVTMVTTNAGLFVSTDGGLTWRNTNFQRCRSAKFIGTSQDIVATNGGSKLNISHDLGLTWKAVTPSASFNVEVVQVRKSDNAIFVLEEDNNTNVGILSYSIDDGATWQQTNGTLYFDCHDFALDACNDTVISVVNESTALPAPDGLGHIFNSYDGGQTFNSTLSKTTNYFCGSIISTPLGILYAQTLAQDGIVRSSDQGMTWNIIGGPSGISDGRLICNKNDTTIFAVDKDGSIWTTDNGGGNSVSIKPNGFLTVTPKIIFLNDTIYCYDSIVHSLALHRSGCYPPSISQLSILGQDSISYSVGSVTFDSLQIIFNSLKPGKNNSLLVITTDNGLIDTIVLNGFNASIPFTFSSTPLNLFTSDSIFICDPPKKETLTLNTNGCLPKIVAQNITGLHAADYTFIRQISDPLRSLDSTIISFTPSDSGVRNAVYEMTLGNGTIISVPLQGFGITPHPLTLSIPNKSTDTIGGSVNVPITINGLDHAEDIDLVLHYNNELTYHGSYSLANVQLDIPTEEWAGRSKLYIAQAKPNSILGYAKFDVFNDSLMKSYLTFDSVTVLTMRDPCQYILPASVTSIITPPSGCGIETLSRFMHEGTMPQFSLSPNPTSGEISIISSANLGEVSVAVYDMLGVKQNLYSLSLSNNSVAKFMITARNGVYNVHVSSQTRAWDLRVVVNR